MSGRPWIKLSTTKIDDARLAMCSDAAQRDYLMLYMLAGRLDADGLFVEDGRQLSEEEIAFKIRVKLARLKASVTEMKKARLVHVNGKGPQITDWGHEQINWREKQEKDRERQQRHRSVTRDGESVTSDSEAVTPPDQKKIRGRKDKRKSRKDSNPPPTPPANKQGGKAGSDSTSLRPSDLPTHQFKLAVMAMEILKSAGLRNPRLKSISVLIATRKHKNKDEFIGSILAALASAYADDTAKDKAMIAAYRLENDQIPAHFRKQKAWDVIPEDVLRAAKIDPKSIGGSGDRWEIPR